MTRESVGRRLVVLRGDKSREEVSKEVEISVSALQMYENGQRMPKDEIKIRLAAYYSVTVQALFFDEEPHVLCGDDQVSTA
ncbi:HTH-type transcriptional regulator Xre [compost metagenome]